MNHRHLLPNEIDLLVDGDSGFGVAPLRAHLQECDDCRALYDDARFVADALEALPHFAPDSRLAQRVMAQVPVFVPAHVAARDSLARWMPQSSAARAAAVAVGTSVAGMLTLAFVWLAMRGDEVAFVTGLLSDRMRNAATAAARDAIVALLGQSTLVALQNTGPVGASLLLLGVVLAAGGTVAGIRRLAAVSGRRA
jgi:predicted anti-sigma-YlaC factor YlaD